MSEINKVKGFNHVKNIHRNYTYFSVFVFNYNESQITGAAVNLFIQL
ncbi:hypothetical protein ACM48_21470 [Escherichia coli]|nr:hypothetical protein ACM48_21470 [Escherichia coli]